MKKIKSLAFFVLLTVCLLMAMPHGKHQPNSFAAENSNVETIDVTTLATDKIVTDSTKKYILTGTTDERTITFRNDSLVEKTFYVTINHLYISGGSTSPVIVIQDNGYKTNINFNIQGANLVAGNLYGAITLSKYVEPAIENENNAEIVLNFSTKDTGILELTSKEGNISSPAIFIQDNVNASLNLSTHNTKLVSLTVASTTYDDFETGILETTKDSNKNYCKIKLDKADVVSKKIEFNMMGRGDQIDAVYLPESQTSYTPPKPANVDGMIFFGWYTDITLNTLWNSKIDTVTEDMTLYAGWFVPTPKQNDTIKQFPVWAIILISVSAGVVLSANAYTIVYFCAYKRGKVNNKFFNAIYKPLKKADTSKTTEEKIQKNDPLNKISENNSPKTKNKTKRQTGNKKLNTKKSK